MSHKRYAILVYISALIIFGVPASFLRIWSNLAGEVSDSLIVEYQKSNPKLLYLSGIRDDVFGYKLELTKQLHPYVIALGSSRSMQVRAKFFNTNFANLGGSVNSIPEFDYVVSQLIKLEQKPSIVLMFADNWWFNDKYQNSRLIYTPPNELDYLTFSNLKLLMKPIVMNGIVISKSDRLGLGAIYQNQGYDSSGSFHYVSTVTGETTSYDIGFQNILGRIVTGTRKFEYADNFSSYGVSRFNKIIDRLEKSKIHVLIVFPPFANPVYKKMISSKKCFYINALTKEINNTHPLFDFTDPNEISGTNDCEFIDGIHGGETVYARIILQISKQDKYLHNVINLDYLSDLLNRHHGTSSPETVSLYGNGKAETDFLDLGCSKNPS